MGTFSNRLKMVRKRAGLTQIQLAEKLGFTPGAVGNWESDKAVPGRATLRKLAEILNSNELFLTGESDIDSGAFIEPTTEYTASLPYSRMTPGELEFIFDSRQKELSTERDPQRRRELLGVISEVSGELQKRIPPETETELTKRAIQAGDNQEIKPEEKTK